jgi:carboxypeptidase C (cathepsin A)
MTIRSVFVAIALTILAMVGAPTSANAVQNEVVGTTKALKGLPAARSVPQSIVIRGKRIDYVTSIGAIDLRDEEDKLIGEVVYTAYTARGLNAVPRPVTFAINGGPGASSVSLNFGAIGPKHIDRSGGSNTASALPVLSDNENSWLPFTDLVFIDPISTGYSRSHLDAQRAKTAFMTADADVHYLSEVIYQWLSRNGRIRSPKYLVGESYGGYRVPRIAYYLQIHGGLGLSGITLVSPYLDPPALGDEDALSPLSLMISLPSLTASHREEQGLTLDTQSMAPVERYAQTEFLSDFFAGASDTVATDRLSAKVAALVGVDPAFMRRLDGRISNTTVLRERHRAQGIVSSSYDASITALDPFPAKETRDYFDPHLGASAPYTEAMVDFVQNQVGWHADGHYIANNYGLYDQFESDTRDSAVTDLRKAMANDPKLKVLITHGWNDLACPYFASTLLIQQMPRGLSSGRLQLRVYPGGHQFYDRPASAAAWREDAVTMYSKN